MANEQDEATASGERAEYPIGFQPGLDPDDDRFLKRLPLVLRGMAEEADRLRQAFASGVPGYVPADGGGETPPGAAEGLTGVLQPGAIVQLIPELDHVGGCFAHVREVFEDRIQVAIICPDGAVFEGQVEHGAYEQVVTAPPFKVQFPKGRQQSGLIVPG